MAKKKTVKETQNLLPRPPVVAVLGHVDHGKTTLLDTIRKTNVTQGESGGITQHIGAYQVEYKGKTITFIDTPGHEAFAKMRARGASVADIAVLVVAANDGVKPQTKESVAHINQADIPIVVAFNKVDLPDIDLRKAKQQLSKEKVIVEDLGGNVVAVELSAKTGKGVTELLDVILLVAEMSEIKGDSSALLEGVVIESKLDKHRGVLATVLVRQGSIKVGQIIFAHGTKAKVKLMVSDKGKTVPLALPSMPVEIMGWEALPQIGALVASQAKVTSDTIASKTKSAYAFELPPIDTSVKLNIIIKTDMAGTMEAIVERLGEDVVVVASGTGAIVESDVLLAKSTKALIIGFHVSPTAQARKLASVEKVQIKTYKVIYKLLDEINEVVELINNPQAQETTLGEAEILAEFTAGDDRVAGCKVKSGRIAMGDKVKLMRGQKQLGLAKIKSLRAGKEDIKKANKGQECGMTFDKKLDFKIKDLIISYKKHELLTK